jgi:hypothetical protein
VLAEPPVKEGVGTLAGLGQRQEHVVPRAVHRHHGRLTAEAARPPGDLADIKHGVGIVAQGRVQAREIGPAGAEYQRRHADVQAAVQPGMPAPDRIEPAERHRTACKRLQVQVEVPFAGAADVQRRPVHPRLRLKLAQRPRLREQAQRLGHGPAQHRLALKVEPRTVQHKARDGRDPPSRSPAVEPQRSDQAARGVGNEEYGQFGMSLGDDGERALKLIVAEREIRHVMRRLAPAPRPARLAQVEGVERQPPFGEEVGQCRLEEVIGEAVHVQDGPTHGLTRPGLAPHKHGSDLPFPVGVGA